MKPWPSVAHANTHKSKADRNCLGTGVMRRILRQLPTSIESLQLAKLKFCCRACAPKPNEPFSGAHPRAVVLSHPGRMHHARRAYTTRRLRLRDGHQDHTHTCREHNTPEPSRTTSVAVCRQPAGRPSNGAFPATRLGLYALLPSFQIKSLGSSELHLSS